MINMKIGVVPRQRCAPIRACPNGSPNTVHTAHFVRSNSAFGRTSFMLKTLCDITHLGDLRK